MTGQVRTVDGRVAGRRGLATRQKLLDCLSEMLSSSPYRDVKVIDVARKAGTSPATFYQYFPDVEGAVLEIAEQMAALSTAPKRSILFVWHVGEEKGLLGAAYFADHATVPRDSIVAQINVDMIGRGGVRDVPGGGPGYLQLIGSRRLSTELGDLIEAVNRRRERPFTFDYQYDATGHPQQFYCRSDHYMYARYGIPVVFMSTGGHVDYHMPTDEPQYLDYDKLRDVTQFIHDVAVEIANRPARLVVERPKPNPRGQCVQ